MLLLAPYGRSAAMSRAYPREGFEGSWRPFTNKNDKPILSLRVSENQISDLKAQRNRRLTNQYVSHYSFHLA